MTKEEYFKKAEELVELRRDMELMTVINDNIRSREEEKLEKLEAVEKKEMKLQPSILNSSQTDRHTDK